jgi:acyl carrier protein
LTCSAWRPPRCDNATFADLDVDSLDLVELAQIVKEEYGVQLTSEDAMKLNRLGDAVDLIASRMP